MQGEWIMLQGELIFRATRPVGPAGRQCHLTLYKTPNGCREISSITVDHFKFASTTFR